MSEELRFAPAARRAKIVATIGPASQEEGVLIELIRAGMNVARLNFSHGTHAGHARLIQRIRRLADRLGQPVAILQDLQGPKIRIGDLDAPRHLQAGETITLTTQPDSAPPDALPVDYPDLPRAVHPGGPILIDDGQIELRVTEVGRHTVQAEVVLGGEVRPHKGLNLPGARLLVPGFTEKDEEDLAFGLKQDVDAVAISFVRTAEDVARVRKAIARLAPERVNLPVIAKLERPEALENLHEIVHAADGVMVARGDLGVEMPPETVPIAQKRIIEMANRHAKLVITATQMLDSMITNPRPTRAEASDVANAIFDGTDAVMLSGETASGRYPVEAVRMMDAIIRQAEEHLDDWGHWSGVSETHMARDDALALTHAARELAHGRQVAAIAVFTQTGRTARLMSNARPRVPILAFTPEAQTYRRMAMYWGVLPFLVPFADTVEQMLSHVEAAMMAATPIQPGERVVILSGFPIGAMRPPNFALLHTVGERS